MVAAFLGFLLLFSCMDQISSGDFIPDTLCGILFSEAEYKGNTFVLKDFDQSMNLKKDYRNSLTGWTETRSIRVSNNCRMTICSGTYFMESCRSVQSGGLSSIDFDLESANCTCKRKCRCEDLSIPQNMKGGEAYIARAYLDKNCDTCDSDYYHVLQNWEFPEEFKRSVKTFVIPTGCTLRVYPEANHKGQGLLLTGPIYQGFNGIIKSASSNCERLDVTENNDLSTVDISALTETQIFELMKSDDLFSTHPGLLAAGESASNKRSASNAYVILIGVSTAYYTGFPQCKDYTYNVLWTCTVSLHLHDLDIRTTLTVIMLPLGRNSDERDYILMATFEEYLMSHPELDTAIPNAVIIHDYFFNENDAKRIKAFHRKFKFVQALHTLLLDEGYPNVVFLQDRLYDLSGKDRRQPESKLDKFEKEVNKIWPFPVNVCVLPSFSSSYVFRNGYQRMANEEYYPRNLKTMLENICEKGGDPLGKAIFGAYFLDNNTPHSSIYHNEIPDTDNVANIDKFRKLFTAST